MRTIGIIGTDWPRPDPAWPRQPLPPFYRDDLESWKKVFVDLCTIARIPCLAVGIRGAYDAYDVNWRAPMRQAYRRASPQPTLCPWFDTVGLPDMVNPPNVAKEAAIPFDFANSVHIVIGWEKYGRVFFDYFADCQLERSPRGKVLIPWWGIASNNGHGFRNQHQAQRLLDYVDQKLYALGLGGADHIVDKTWLEFVPNLNVSGVHDWFNPWTTPPAAYSIRTHHGVTVGVTVPSFYQIINPEGNADTIRHSLDAMRAAQADVVFIESGTNFSEAAELMRDSTGNTSKLDAVREHIELTTGDTDMDAVTKTPLVDFVLFNSLLPGSEPNTYALPWNEAKGEVDPSSNRVFSLQKDGTIQTRSNVLNAEGGIRSWVSGRIIGDKLVFNTEGAAVKVFGLIRGV